VSTTPIGSPASAGGPGPGADQLYFDLFVTALEGGIGYWSACRSYRWSKGGDGITEDPTGFRAEVVDWVDGDGTELVIDRAVIARGYSLATGEWRDRLAWSSGEKPPLVVTPDTEWDYDAGDADCIVQLGLFGEVVYG
jgi:hypothetical protein